MHEDSEAGSKYLENFTTVGCPCITQTPCSILVAIKYSNLAVNGACRASVAVGVEGNSLDEVLVAVLQIEFERLLLVTR